MCARAHVLHVHSDIYTYLYAFTGYSVKDGTTGKRDDWLCKNKLKTSRNEMLLLKSRREKKMFLILLMFYEYDFNDILLLAYNLKVVRIQNI